jgi:hypothetical protein
LLRDFLLFAWRDLNLNFTFFGSNNRPTFYVAEITGI